MMEVVFDAKLPTLGGNVRHGDLNTYCPVTWSFLIDRFAVSSMLDVGCGEGHAVAYFHRRGVFAHGFDGLMLNVARSVVPVSLHDLTSGPFVMPVDLVWSCEVAEHIPAEFVDHYIKSLCNGRIVAMTHALPEQSGHNHVNCQPPDYWINLMARENYRLSENMDVFKSVAEKEANFTYFRHSGLVFVRQG